MAGQLVDDDLIDRLRHEAAAAQAREASQAPDEVGNSLEFLAKLRDSRLSRVMAYAAPILLTLLVAAVVAHDSYVGSQVEASRESFARLLSHPASLKQGVRLSQFEGELVGPAVVTTRPTPPLALRRHPRATRMHEYRWAGWAWDRTVTAFVIPGDGGFKDPRVVAID